MMMQPAVESVRHDASNPLNGARDRLILIQAWKSCNEPEYEASSRRRCRAPKIKM